MSEENQNPNDGRYNNNGWYIAYGVIALCIAGFYMLFIVPHLRPPHPTHQITQQEMLMQMVHEQQRLQAERYPYAIRQMARKSPADIAAILGMPDSTISDPRHAWPPRDADFVGLYRGDSVEVSYRRDHAVRFIFRHLEHHDWNSREHVISLEHQRADSSTGYYESSRHYPFLRQVEYRAFRDDGSMRLREIRVQVE